MSDRCMSRGLFPPCALNLAADGFRASPDISVDLAYGVQSARRFALGLVLLVLIALALPFNAWGTDRTPAKSSPDEVVRTTTEALFEALGENRQAIEDDPNRALVLVDETVMPHVDLPKISRWILGREWRRATPSQRERFMEEFRVLLVRSYATAVSQNTDVAITYLPVRLKKGGKDATVQTRILVQNGQPLDITYRLHENDHGWKLYDVVVAGVSLVANYRSTFAAQIRQVGIDGLINQLATNNSLPAQSKRKPKEQES